MGTEKANRKFRIDYPVCPWCDKNLVTAFQGRPGGPAVISRSFDGLFRHDVCPHCGKQYQIMGRPQTAWITTTDAKETEGVMVKLHETENPNAAGL